MKKVIYAVYGSNLLKERFLAYIKGGFYKGKNYEGCTDKNDPIDRGWQFIPRRLYFAKKSGRWDSKGVAFITCEREPDKNFHTLVRLWEITEEQFSEIWEQEGRGWYDKKINLGTTKDEKEIITITGCWENEKNFPAERYIEIIRKGLKETTNWSDKKIEEYLSKFIGDML